ncbi:hypothetical protein EI94DRAFT_1731041 [Lactarius quietus]|nr:hypothetical protein EI94DRAFT_1731041 [Lactarius quietus]
MCHAIQLLVGECKLLLVLFRLANLTIVIIFLQFSKEYRESESSEYSEYEYSDYEYFSEFYFSDYSRRNNLWLMKYATFLWPSNKPQSAIFQAGQNFQRANMDSKIEEYLKAFSPKDNVERFAGFIMTTDMVPSQSSIGTGESSRSGFRSQFLQSLPIFQKLRRKD